MTIDNIDHNQYPSGGLSPEDALATAVAMADRSTRSQIIAECITAEINGVEPPVADLESRRAGHLGHATLMLLQLEDPSRQLMLSEYFDAKGTARHDKHTKKLAEETGLYVDSSLLKENEKILATTFQAQTGISDEYLTAEFAKDLAAAQEVATEAGTDLATVYIDDELYYAAQRKVDSPDSHVDATEKLLNGISESIMEKALLQVLDSALPAGLLNDLTPEDIAEIALEIQLDETFQSEMSAQVATVREGARQFLLYSFIRTFGYEAINQLDERQQEIILPKMKLAKTVADLLRESK